MEKQLSNFEYLLEELDITDGAGLIKLHQILLFLVH